MVNHADTSVEVLQVLSRPPSSQSETPSPRGLFSRSTNQAPALPSSSSVWTFVYPGCHIYQWSTSGNSERKVKNKLDCSKLVPSSESLKTIAIDEHFSTGRCQVASMCIQVIDFILLSLRYS